MKNKFQLGEEVSVEFMGKITGIKIRTELEGLTCKEQIVYDITDGKQSYAYEMKESYVYPLPQPPEIFEKVLDN